MNCTTVHDSVKTIVNVVKIPIIDREICFALRLKYENWKMISFQVPFIIFIPNNEKDESGMTQLPYSRRSLRSGFI